MSNGRSRSAAVAIACLALLLAAICFDDGEGVDSSPVPTAAQPTASRPSAPSPAPDIDPRPFLHAFLRYELGEPDPALQRELRATTTPSFATELLSSPVRAPKPPLPPASITQLRISDLSSDPPRALVSGSARRAGSPEQFSFLFEARRDVWLASGPAE